MKKTFNKGILLMIVSAFLTANGQLFWKFSQTNNKLINIAIGFLLYGFGALFMIFAFKNGELSVLYPLMCISYVFALINGYIFLGETISIYNLIGILIIILGVTLLGKENKV
ncbi:EamA family transporter [Caloramator sp. ALD01]|uniref:EamA family transporter n=1 Tax=Caloramator sp. ALD01 TaxID=1031288 RepID=UPI000403217F|nr:EamA family transporter [Caloramator sp. ALD01]